MAGISVNRSVVDARIGEAVLALRSAFDKVENIAKFLANNPAGAEGDPLVNEYGYTTDEAYLIRVTFESFDSIRTTNVNQFDIARKLTGLD